MNTSPAQRPTNQLVSLAPQLDYILVDGSSSMQDKWWESLDAIDAYLTPLKAANLNTQVICSVFCPADISFKQRNSTLADFQPLKEAPLTSYWGGTPLFDAINIMGRDLRDLDPKRASVVIVTDGHENGSQVTSEVQARAVLDWIRAKGWQVTFIGCDFNNSRQARALGANSNTAIGVQKRLLTDAAKALGEKRTRHYHGADSMSFSDAEKQQFGGYLNAPGA